MTKIFKLYQLPNLILQKLFPISKVRKYRTLKASFPTTALGIQYALAILRTCALPALYQN